MNELIVSASEEGLRIGILEDKRIVELHHEKTNSLFSVGDLLLGKVTKIVPGLNAAFVEIGHPKDAFLHYLDLGPQVMSLQRYVKAVQSSAQNIRPLGQITPLPDISKDGRMATVLKAGQPILVQVEKEAISTKGPRLTCEISLPGQYLILVPFSEDISVSRKIATNDEKRRLKSIVEAVKPKGFGLIIRTAAEGREAAAIEKDMNDLLDKWDKMIRSIAEARPPKRVLAEEDRAASILRDMLSIGFDSIVTDQESAFEEISEYLKRTSPEQLKNLKMHQGKVSLFESRGVEKQIKAAFGKTVTMRNGSYLVIEHTEAMHVIDVNSGSKNLRGDTLEENALKTNMVAAEEIARQLRLRDMGGIIVIDFIDLKKVENKKRLHQHLKDAMASDLAKHTILPMSRFGLIQITRQRVRPQIDIVTTEACPSCNGTGTIQPAILLIDEIKNNVDFLMRQNKDRLTVTVHPLVEAYFKRGFWNQVRKWWWEYKKPVKVVPDTALSFTEVRYHDAKGVEIKF
ncbi:MAG: Rne/Rng family ribonuclease [Bacteroidetes bacterium]|nr:Rne/Rng family ribonuclease [Bacteroidota bacterium]MBL0018599.1 Rne/Rng family ribonuclease [Bacteroidota bacterium]MBP6638854.1 Rne/Rng family ribonuclease [Bacteroidia bacterium]MBP8074231.1 Rne/Rng family ribonuclease [Bacteroidia bacterium]